MGIAYQVQVVKVGRQEWFNQLQEAIRNELTCLGLHNSLRVEVSEHTASGNTPSLVLVFGEPGLQVNISVQLKIQDALSKGLLVIPVVDNLSFFAKEIPHEVSQFNAFEWSGDKAPQRLAHIVLEQLGIEEGDRRVFISYRRTDGLGAAEQLHDALSHKRFKPFIDRFSIDPGEDVQAKIADVLEDFAFLLLLETPEAHTSDWVYDELDYALAHTLGILIVQWPGSPKEVPGSSGIQRLVLQSSDIKKDTHNYDILTSSAVNKLTSMIEDAHAFAIVRRRRNLLQSVDDTATESGAVCTPLKDWTLDVAGANGAHSIVRVSARLPTCKDLQQLDETREKIDHRASARLIHAARHLSDQRREHLDWIVRNRDLTFISDNMIGAKW